MKKTTVSGVSTSQIGFTLSKPALELIIRVTLFETLHFPRVTLDDRLDFD